MCQIKFLTPCIFISARGNELIICESLQVLETAQQVGINCLNMNLDEFLPLASVYKFVGLQWSIYTVILAYRWSYYGIKKVKL